MTVTEKLYDRDAYLTEFTAQILSCRQEGDRFHVILDRTAFFPEAGGQTPDRGVLIFSGDPAGVREASVSDVQIDDAGVITHVTDRELPASGTVNGRIDWEHRFDNMQQHTGEHIFSGLVCGRFGCDNVGFHLSDQTVTMDYNKVLSPEMIRETERLANEAVWRDLPVEISFPSEEELSEIPYRSKKELSGQIRIVTIPGVDICACCAPHVRHTGEIGLLKVIAVQNYKGGVRVTIRCGSRAFSWLSAQSEILGDLARELSTAPEGVPGHLKKLKEELSETRRQAAEHAEKAMAERLEKITNDIITNDTKHVLLFDPLTDGNAARRVLNRWTQEHAGVCCVFLGSDETGYQYLIAASSDGADARETAGILAERFGAKGGGSREMTQGRVRAPEAEIRRILGTGGISENTEQPVGVTA
ncbi:MAG: hypothetical protein K6G16_00360 [Lachnospiraceae bacterium]|nr:hypothetical protein [Lachnospiraceae bacterium]